MPLWAYRMPPAALAVLMVSIIELVSIAGLLISRRWLQPRLRYHDGINDAISGTVQAVGVFYGITVGLIAVGVWNSYTGASDVVAREASYLGALFRDVSTLPEPTRTEGRKILEEYTVGVIQTDWPAQREGRRAIEGRHILDRLQALLAAFEPHSEGEKLRYAETLSSYNRLAAQRRLRLDAVESGLSGLMWSVIWVGAAISIGIAYLFHVEDVKLHVILVGLMAGFLAIVLYMIVLNDKPFYGEICITPDSYQLILDVIQDKVSQ